MKIFIGSDHTGFDLKEKLQVHLSEQGHEVLDKGAFDFNPDDDYPDFIRPVAEEVVKSPKAQGIIIGGTGFGEAICANRVRGARAVVFYGPMIPIASIDIEGKRSEDPYEIVKLSKHHNDSNILSLGVRFITEDEAKEAVRVFLETPFSGEERHRRRIQKLG